MSYDSKNMSHGSKLLCLIYNQKVDLFSCINKWYAIEYIYTFDCAFRSLLSKIRQEQSKQDKRVNMLARPVQRFGNTPIPTFGYDIPTVIFITIPIFIEIQWFD